MQGLNGGLHTWHGGGHQGRQTHQFCAGLAHGLHNTLRVHITAQIQHIIAVVFQNNAHNVLANVVNVTLDRGNHNLALAALLLARGGDFGLDGFKGGLRGGGSLQQLRQEHSSLFKAIAHGVQRRNQ